MQTITLNGNCDTSSRTVRILDGTLDLVVNRMHLDNAIMLLNLFPEETIKIIKIIRAYSSYGLRESKAIYDAAKYCKAYFINPQE